MSPLMLLPLLAANLASPAHVREVRAAGLVLHVAAFTSAGAVSDAEIDVRGRSGVQRIHLGQRDMDAAMLLSSVRIVDVNFDGYADVVVLREWGAKWSAVDVFLYEPGAHRFSNRSPLARALSGLQNAEVVAAQHVIKARSVGPSSPSSTTYAIDGARLRIVESCRFINPISERTGTLVRVRDAQTTYTHLRLSPSDIEPCSQ